MPKRTNNTSKQSQTTAQRLGSVIKSARDLMRKDKGLNGELDRLPQLTWIMFLKLLDDLEKVREDEAFLEGKIYQPLLKYPYRWRDWVKQPNEPETSLHLLSGDQFLQFINSEKVTLPDGKEYDGLFAYLRSIQSYTGRERQDIIREVFRDVNNRMISGALLRDVVNKINDLHFDSSEEVNILSNFYESMLKEMRDAAGDSGEFYTPRPVIRFMVKVIAPKLGETIHDPACGTAGFLIEVYEYLKGKCKADEWAMLQASLSGVEAKPLPYMLAQMNLLLHGVEYPDVEHRNSLGQPISNLGQKDQFDIILTNPPFGGEEEDKIKNNFPPKMQTSETALLFFQLIMRLLKKNPKPGRGGIVVPNGVLFGDGICAKVKEQLLTQFNLHTIVRLPNGVFEPYTKIPTNLLFFDASGSTGEIWYYEVALPEGMKNYTKTKPMQDEDFDGCLAWWDNREENGQAWRYNFRAVYEEAKTKAQPHWDTANEALGMADKCSKQIKELEEKIKVLDVSNLDFPPVEQKKLLQKQIKQLKEKLKVIQAEEQQYRGVAKEEQTKGDEIYWSIFNLDKKNPNSGQDFEHLPPDKLVADIMAKDLRVAEIMAEIKDILSQ